MKLDAINLLAHHLHLVATTPTVYGIETHSYHSTTVTSTYVATTPTVYGIETIFNTRISIGIDYDVATTPTVYGIETLQHNYSR